MQSFLEALNTRPMFFDGAMGTLLQSRGLSPGELPESWNYLSLLLPTLVEQLSLRAISP